MKKYLFAVPAIALTIAGLTGCIAVVPSADPQTVVIPAQSSATSEDASASPGTNDAVETDTSASEEDPSLVDSVKDKVSEKAEKMIDLKPESGVMYLHASQAFSPGLDRWVVDGNEVHYKQYNCLGGQEEEVYGTLSQKNAAENTYDVVFEGMSPELFLSGSSTEVIIMTERTLIREYGSGDELATTNAELQTDKFIGMCKDAGETLVGFVF